MFIAENFLPVDIAAFPFSQALLYGLLATLGILCLSLCGQFLFKREVTEAQKRSIVSKLIYAIFIVTITILAVTSFGSILRFGHMLGWSLLIHVATAGAFVFLLLAIAFLFLPNGAKPEQRGYTADGRWWFARWSAWGLVLFSIATAATMFTSMLPILDTDGLLEFAALHRYAGLGTVIFAALHLYAMLCVRFNWR